MITEGNQLTVAQNPWKSSGNSEMIISKMNFNLLNLIYEIVEMYCLIISVCIILILNWKEIFYSAVS